MMKKLGIFVLLLAIFWGFYASGLLGHLSLQGLQAERGHWQEMVNRFPLSASLAFFAIYVLVTSLSLPGAAALTLAGGALFGFWWGLLLISFASSLGASLSFLLSRYFLRAWLKQKFNRAFRELDHGFERDGTAYLVFLRLAPVFPFFLVNLFAGLTSISLPRFYLLSQLAMLPGTAVYVNAGTELGRIGNISEVLSGRVFIAFTLLGIFPFLAKKGVERWRTKRHAH